MLLSQQTSSPEALSTSAPVTLFAVPSDVALARIRKAALAAVLAPQVVVALEPFVRGVAHRRRWFSLLAANQSRDVADVVARLRAELRELTVVVWDEPANLYATARGEFTEPFGKWRAAAGSAQAVQSQVVAWHGKVEGERWRPAVHALEIGEAKKHLGRIVATPVAPRELATLGPALSPQALAAWCASHVASKG